MLDMDKACRLAEVYFQQILGLGYTDRILENEEFWFFCSGNGTAVRVGNVIISVNKKNGEITEMPMPSHETVEILKNARIANITEKEEKDKNGR